MANYDERHDRRLMALRRDSAMARLSRARRWVIALAAGLTAALAGLASALLPGKSLAAKHGASGPAATTASRSTSGTPGLPPAAGASALGLQGPDQSPASSSGSSSSAAPQSSSSPAPAPAPQSSAPAPAPAPAQAPAATSGGS